MKKDWWNIIWLVCSWWRELFKDLVLHSWRTKISDREMEETNKNERKERKLKELKFKDLTIDFCLLFWTHLDLTEVLKSEAKMRLNVDSN